MPSLFTLNFTHYTCKMLVPLQVLQKSLHKQRSGVILRLSISPMCFFPGNSIRESPKKEETL